MKRGGGKHRPLFKQVWDAIPWDEPVDARDISAVVYMKSTRRERELV